jgi:5-methylcytosine-specific restriction enzyme subunit McrC
LIALRRASEWDDIPINGDAGPKSLTRRQADGLLGVAQRAARHLSLPGEEGQRVLMDGRTRVRTGQVVGVLASADVTLEILPKIDSENDDLSRESVVRMLARTFDLPISDGEMVGVGHQQHDLLEILIRLFCKRLFDAIRGGLPRRYIAYEDDLNVVRGRLNFTRQFTRLLTTPQKLACRFDELSTDIPLNQIIKAAVNRLKRISRSADNSRHLFELVGAYSEVTDVPPNALRWEFATIDRTNKHWADLLRFARLLLGDRFQSTAVGADFGYSLLFEMNTLFEEFIGRSIRSAITQRVSLQYRSGHALFDDQGKKYFSTIPDIAIHSDTDGLDWVVDTKWKRLTGPIDDRRLGVAQSDVYQLMGYAQVHSCPRVMLLYPHHSAMGIAAGRVAEFNITGSQSKLVVATVDLTNIPSVPKQLENIFHPATRST